MAVAGGSVARRYARALFGIGVDAGRFEELGRELDEFVSVWADSAELRQTLENPVFKPEQKRAVLQQILPRRADARGAAVRAAAARSQPHRAAAGHRARVPGDGRRARGARARAGDVAEPLTQVALDRVRRSLEQRTGKKVVMQTAVDPELIGGLVARVGDLVLDGSVRTQLEDLRSKLLN